MQKIQTDATTHLTPFQLARRWGWHEESIRRKIRRGEIVSILIGRRRLIPLAEVQRLESESTITTKTKI